MMATDTKTLAGKPAFALAVIAAAPGQAGMVLRPRQVLAR